MFAVCGTAPGKDLAESASKPGPGWKLEADDSLGSGNPFLGKLWINDGGFIYTFGRDGTICVEHHCGLKFERQFSYLIWKNILVIYGAEMDSADTLRAGTIRAAGDSIIFSTTGGETITYTPAGAGAGETGAVPDNIFTGTWLAGGALYEFTAGGTIVQAGKSAGHSYLVRKDRLVTLSHERFPALREYRFEKTGNGITVSPAGGGSPLLYSRYGE
jgi:hypothetical protein